MADKMEIYKLTYKIIRLEELLKDIRILGEIFFNNNKTFGLMFINNKISPLKDTIPIKDIKGDKLTIKIIFFKNIRNKSFMFKDCFFLKSVSQKENYYQKKIKNDYNYVKKSSKYSSNNALNYITNMREMFSCCFLLTKLPDLSKWNTKYVIDMSFMFFNCRSLISLPDLSKWNTDNVIDMSYMFYNCYSLKIIPGISNWNYKNVLYMFYMFDNCPLSIPILDYGPTEMNCMRFIMVYKNSNKSSLRILGKTFVENNEFKGKIIFDYQQYPLIEEFPIENIITPTFKLEMQLNKNIHDLSGMFEGCDHLLEFKEYNYFEEKKIIKQTQNDECFVDLLDKEWNKKMDMLYYRIYYKENEKYLNQNENYTSIEKINENEEDNSTIKYITDNLSFQPTFTNMSCMFNECASLKILPDLSKWNTDNVTDISSMFSRCAKLISLPDISKWNTSNVTNMNGIFFYCTSLKILPDLSKWNMKKVTNIRSMFSGCAELMSLPDISKWNTNNLSQMDYTFWGCIKLISLPDISKWNTSSVTDMSNLFYDCESLISLPDLSKWNTSNVTNISNMFNNCRSLISLPDISKWNTNNIKELERLFKNCRSLISLPDISKWNTSNILIINGDDRIFNSLSSESLISLISVPDISIWKTEIFNITHGMFENCLSLISLPDLSKWNTSNVQDIDEIISGCLLL